MCEWRALRRVLAPLALLLCGANVSGAQSPDPLANQRAAAQRARARLDSVRAVRDRLTEDRLSRPVVRRYGALVVRGDTTDVPAAYMRALDSAVAGTRPTMRALFGEVADTLLTNTVLLIEAVRVDTSDDGRPDAGLLHVVIRAHQRGDQGGGTSWVTGGPASEFPSAEFSGSLTARYVDAANARVRSLRWWAASPISTAPWAPLVRDGAYYTLATYPTRVGRACIDGSLSACRAALALVPGADTLRAWFDGEERRARAIDRALAASPRVDAVRHSLVADIEACRQSGADSACHALLQRVGVPSPTSDHSRREFLRLALAHGAPGTFARLIATDSADVGPRLATAAQLPLDSLVAMWRSRMLEGRPPAPMPSAPEVTLCVVIGTALVAVAAGRRP